MRTRIAQVVERRARNPEVRVSNPGSGSNFSLEILYCISYILILKFLGRNRDDINV